MRRLHGTISSMVMNLSKLWEIVKDREAWRTAVHGVTKSQTLLCDWRLTKTLGIFTVEEDSIWHLILWETLKPIQLGWEVLDSQDVRSRESWMFLFFPTSLSEHPFPNSYTTKIFVTLLSTSFLALTRKIMPSFTYLMQLQRRITQFSNWLNWNIKPIGLIGKSNFPSLQLVYNAGDAVLLSACHKLLPDFQCLAFSGTNLLNKHFWGSEDTVTWNT